MEDMNGELSLDMIGNMSEEEIKEFNEKEKEEITDDESLFPIEDDNGDIDNQEGVGDESQEGEKDNQFNQKGDSPNIYASIATALKKDGILTLDDSDFEDIKDAEDLAILFTKMKDKLVNDSLDENQKRIREALDSGVELNVVKQCERTINYLNTITDDSLKEETQEAEDLRGNIIMQDYLNEGISQEKAAKLVQASFDAGTDVEDAIKSLENNKKYFNSVYQREIQTSKDKKEESLKAERELNKKIEDRFLKTEEPIKGVKLTEKERKDLLNSYTKFIDKDNTTIVGGKGTADDIKRKISEIKTHIANTTSDYDREKGTVTLVFQIVGKSTQRVRRQVGQRG